jgi:hypothetical protein
VEYRSFERRDASDVREEIRSAEQAAATNYDIVTGGSCPERLSLGLTSHCDVSSSHFPATTSWLTLHTTNSDSSSHLIICFGAMLCDTSMLQPHAQPSGVPTSKFHSHNLSIPKYFPRTSIIFSKPLPLPLAFACPSYHGGARRRC